MAATRETTAANVKWLSGPLPVRKTPGAAVAAGEAVYLDSAGKVQPTNGGAVATNLAYGIALQAAAAADDPQIDIAVDGARVQCMTGATPGALVYTNDTAGEFDETGGTKKTVLGLAESATILMVRTQVRDFS